MPVHNIQSWGAIEEEHVRRHFRERDGYWSKNAPYAAKNCVRQWQQLHPDEADNVKIDDVIKFREFVRGPKHPGPAKQKSRLADRQPKKENPKVNVTCVDFPPCQQDFMYMESLVDHVLHKHTNKTLMRCDCGEVFTHGIDLEEHVEEVHTGNSPTGPSRRMDAAASTLDRHNQIAGPVSSAQAPRESAGQAEMSCTGFPPCTKTFKDERGLTNHIRSHKAHVSRRANKGRSPAQPNAPSETAGAIIPRTQAGIEAATLGSDRSSPLPSEESDQEVVTLNPGEQRRNAIAARAMNVSTRSFSSSERSVGENGIGMGVLPKIKEQLLRNIVNVLENCPVQAFLPEQIFRHMQSIMKTTSDMTDELLGVYQYATFIEDRATCLDPVTELSAVVFGHTRVEEIRRIVYGFQSQQVLTLNTILRAYTAAAITQWVLRVDFRDRYGAPGITGDGLDIRRQKMEDFLKKASPDLYAVLDQKHYQEYLQSEVAAGVDCRSRKLADDLYHILLRLFDGKVGEVNDGSQQMRGVSAPESRIRRSDYVRSLLFQIFQKAFEVTLLMHKHPDEYDIDFPAWPARYVVGEMRTLEPQFPLSSGQVCMCVCPRISHKKSLNTIVQASVSLVC